MTWDDEDEDIMPLFVPELMSPAMLQVLERSMHTTLTNQPRRRNERRQFNLDFLEEDEP